MRKLFALAVVFIMVMSMSVVAFATGADVNETGTLRGVESTTFSGNSGEIPLTISYNMTTNMYISIAGAPNDLFYVTLKKGNTIIATLNLFGVGEYQQLTLNKWLTSGDYNVYISQYTYNNTGYKYAVVKWYEE